MGWTVGLLPEPVAGFGAELLAFFEVSADPVEEADDGEVGSLADLRGSISFDCLQPLMHNGSTQHAKTKHSNGGM